MSSEPDRSRQIDDPEDLSQTGRIQGLLKRRDHALNTIEEAGWAIARGELRPDQARQACLHALRSLILDLWTKLDDVVDKEGRNYLEKVPIGTFTVSVPAELPQNPRDKRVAPGATPPQPRHYKITGLRWFVYNEFPIQETFEVRTMQGGPAVDRATVEAYPSFQLLYRAIVKCEEAMDELGIDAKLGAEDGDAEFDYSDILDNGPGGEFPEIDVVDAE